MGNPGGKQSGIDVRYTGTNSSISSGYLPFSFLNVSILVNTGLIRYLRSGYHTNVSKNVIITEARQIADMVTLCRIDPVRERMPTVLRRIKYVVWMACQRSPQRRGNTKSQTKFAKIKAVPAGSAIQTATRSFHLVERTQLELLLIIGDSISITIRLCRRPRSAPGVCYAC